MKYNIGFTLGDLRGDGHACTTDYHIVANHSADEISKAYKETTKLLGFYQGGWSRFSVKLLDTRKIY